ncbi:phosphoglycerate kinase [Salinarchaeum sp. Harcht-Bsk1]|uniref:phosphoglycerate kinase n=1 Tax=Salinarchaeum sp. Harcht-Bsk1 TaxID=1333523 RepID=UPI000342338F|nr:phosphoglycerate kinase [Salinarchaeum sp. Harcht-Bsk1]AGN00382.1 phosphoglycerate kinase [Salinarchaeum sp. Harcht-Bsk1]
MAAFHTTDELDPGQRLLVRIDVNAPIEDGEVQSTRRFERHAESIRELLDAGHALAIMAHQGRPGRDTFTGLEQHAFILSDLVGEEIEYVPSTFGEEAVEAIADLEPNPDAASAGAEDAAGDADTTGEAILLENVRMTDGELPEEPPEVKAQTEFVRTLAKAFDGYVNDGYSVAHRSHASIVGFPEVMDSYAGPVMADEYEYNTSVERREFDGDVTMVLGGTKAEDVIAAMDHLEDTVDTFLLGGVVGELFLRARGHPVGHDLEDGPDLYDENYEKNEDLIADVLDRFGDRIETPVDLAYEDENGERAEHAVVDVEEKTVSYMDIGHETVEAYRPIVEDSAAVLVKGALGVFEDERFSYGTVEVLRAAGESDAFCVVGGGDTARTVPMYDLDPAGFDHLSIAGGAYLQALTGEGLVGVDALERAAERMDG